MAEDLEREAGTTSREKEKTSSTLEVLRAGLRGASGDGDGDGDVPESPVAHGSCPPLGKGKQALLRRLWASHRLRRAAAECVGGDAAEAVDAPPREWAEAQMGRATGGANDWVDETSGGFGEALDAFARRESSEVGRNTVSVLRASAELRRRAGDVLG